MKRTISKRKLVIDKNKHKIYSEYISNPHFNFKNFNLNHQLKII